MAEKENTKDRETNREKEPQPISPVLDHQITEEHKRVNLRWLRNALGRPR
jgi:hypothetical protein